MYLGKSNIRQRKLHKNIKREHIQEDMLSFFGLAAISALPIDKVCFYLLHFTQYSRLEENPMKQKWLLTGTALLLAAALDAASIAAADAIFSATTLDDVAGITCYKVDFSAGG